MVNSLCIYLNGPVRAVAVAAISAAGAIGVIGQIEAIGSAWMWTTFFLLAVLATSFVDFHRSRTALSHQIDNLHRDGLALLDELRQPPEPERREREVVYGIGPPAGGWERVKHFDQQIRDLFVERFPALLTEYANTANAHIRQRRESGGEQRRSAPMQTLADFSEHIYLEPARRLEACLHGLSGARYKARLK